MDQKTNRTKNILERYLTSGEEKLENRQPRNELGQFISKKDKSEKNKGEKKNEKKKEVKPKIDKGDGYDIKLPELMLIKVKGTYGTFNVVEKKKIIPEKIINTLLGYIIIFIAISTLTRMLVENIVI